MLRIKLLDDNRFSNYWGRFILIPAPNNSSWKTFPIRNSLISIPHLSLSEAYYLYVDQPHKVLSYFYKQRICYYMVDSDNLVIDLLKREIIAF